MGTDIKIYDEPIAPELYSPPVGSLLTSALVEFIWDVGNMSIQKYRFVMSNNIAGHEEGFVPQIGDVLIVYDEIQGNIREVPQVPHGYDPLYVNLFFTSAEVENHKQYEYNTLPLGILSPADGATVQVGEVPVVWVASNLGDHYNISVEFVDDPGIVLYERTNLTTNSNSIPDSVPRDGGDWLITVSWVERSFVDTVTVTPALALEYYFPVEFSGWDNLKETLTYASHINTYRDGTQHRYSVSPSFSHKLSVDVPVTPEKLAILLQVVAENGEKETFVPFWQYALDCITWRSDTEYGLGELAEVQYKPYTVGQKVLLWNSETHYVITYITQRTPDTIRVAEAIGRYTKIVPVFKSDITYAKGGSLKPNGMVSFAMSFVKHQLKPDYELMEDRSGSNPAWATANGTVMYVPNEVSLSFTQLKYNLKSKAFTRPIITGEKTQANLTYSLPLLTAREISEFTYWFTKQRGVQNTFIHPIASDIYQIAEVGANHVYLKLYTGTLPVIDTRTISHLIFRGYGSSPVSSISVTNGHIKVDTELGLPQGIPLTCEVYLGFEARLASDSITLNWVSNSQATVQLSVVEALSGQE